MSQALKSSSLRIIGGRWRGRKMSFYESQGLRPTGDRIRETLFNWLAADITNAQCLDMFAGSGALTFEALSRGASHVTAIEKSLKACESIRATAATLETTALTLIQDHAEKWLAKTPPIAIDIVFIDPPFNSNLVVPTVKQLITNGWLSFNALLYIESSANQAPIAKEVDSQLTTLRNKTSGQVSYQLWQFKPIATSGH